jgi:hypothetical protein
MLKASEASYGSSYVTHLGFRVIPGMRYHGQASKFDELFDEERAGAMRKGHADTEMLERIGMKAVYEGKHRGVAAKRMDVKDIQIPGALKDSQERFAGGLRRYNAVEAKGTSPCTNCCRSHASRGCDYFMSKPADLTRRKIETLPEHTGCYSLHVIG